MAASLTSAAAVAAGGDDKQLLFFKQKWSGDDKLWIAYWLGREKRLGIASLPNTVYELEADKDTQKGFLGGNIAKSLVDERWNTMFEEGRVKITKADDESATISYVVRNVLELPRVENTTASRQRIEMLFEFFLDRALQLKRIEEKQEAASPKKNNNYSPITKSVNRTPVKRRLPQQSRKHLRNLPTLGINFDEVIEEDKQRLRVLHPPTDTGSSAVPPLNE